MLNLSVETYGVTDCDLVDALREIIKQVEDNMVAGSKLENETGFSFSINKD